MQPDRWKSRRWLSATTCSNAQRSVRLNREGKPFYSSPNEDTPQFEIVA